MIGCKQVTVNCHSPRKRVKTDFTPRDIDLWLSGTQLKQRQGEYAGENDGKSGPGLILYLCTQYLSIVFAETGKLHLILHSLRISL